MCIWEKPHRQLLERGASSKNNLTGHWTNLQSVMYHKKENYWSAKLLELLELLELGT